MILVLHGLRYPDIHCNIFVSVHKEILFTGTIPKSVKGEQLMAQLLGCIINKMALHSLGRIQMAMWIPNSLYAVSTIIWPGAG